MAATTLLELVNSVNADAQVVANEIASMFGAASKLSQDRADIARDRAGNDEIVMLTQQQGLLKTQELNARTATQIGTNMNEQGNIVSSLMDTVNSSFKEIQRLDQVITAKESVGFLDNPLQWIFNQIDLDSLYAQRNGSATQHNAALGEINALNDLTQNQIQTNEAIKQTVSAVSAEAAAKSVAAIALDKSKEAEIAVQQFNVTAVKELQSASQTQLNNIFALRSAVDAEKSMEMRKQEFDERASDRELRRMELQDKIDKKKAEANEEQEFMATINAGAKSLNRPLFRDVDHIKLYMKTTEGKNSVQNLYDYGFQVLQSAGGQAGTPVLAPTPALAASILIDSKGQLSPAQKPIQELITNAYSDVRSGRMQLPNLDTKNPAAVLSATDAEVGTRVKQMERDVTRDKESNIYAAPPIQAIYEVVPALKQTALYNNVLKLEAENAKVRELDPNYLLSRTVDALSKKQITYNQAVEGLGLLFQGAVETNNAMRDYSRVGLPEQRSFNASVKTDPNAVYFTEDRTVDLADTVQLSNALNRLLVNRIMASKLANAAATGMSPLDVIQRGAEIVSNRALRE